MEAPDSGLGLLIHAATMVTAGVYMVVRTHALFDRAPLALTVVAVIGAATAFFAATVGIVQTDIKRVLAYSTISQLGYMFLACGAAAYSAAIFHLVTHAFFQGAALPWRPVPSSTQSAASRTCASWAACDATSRSPSGP